MTGAIAGQEALAPILSEEQATFSRLKQRRDELFLSPPWIEQNFHTKDAWNQWAEELKQEIRRTPNPELINLSNVDFFEKFGQQHFDNYVDFSKLVFPGDVFFDRVRFKGGVSFKDSVFLGVAKFGPRIESENAASNNGNFYVRTTFDGATFAETVIFTNSIFNSSPTFLGTTFYSQALFDKVQFRRSCYLEECKFLGAVTFANAAFSHQGLGDSEVSFRRSKFADSLSFEECLFRGSVAGVVPVDFTEVDFRKGANFLKSRFGDVTDGGEFRQANPIFRDVEVGERLVFNGCDFRSDFLGMEGCRFDAELSFEEAHFYKKVSFSKAKFLRPLGTAFNGSRAHFHGDANFDEVNFEGDASFEAATFSATVNFNESRFLGKAIGVAQVSFSRCVFQGLVDFQSVEVGKVDQICEINFSDSKFMDSATVNFYGSVFSGSANFSSAKFETITKLERIKFSGELNFSDAEFKRRCSIVNFHGSGGSVNFNHAIVHDVFELDCDNKSAHTLLSGPVFFQHAQFKESVLLRNITFANDVSFEKAKFQRDITITNSTFGTSSGGEQSTLLDFSEARFSERLKLRELNIHSEIKFSRSPGVLSLDVENVTITDRLPMFNRMQIEDPEEVNRIRFEPSVERVLKRSVHEGDQADKRDASKRLRQLADYAEAANDLPHRDHLLDCAQDLAPDPLKGSKLLHYSTTLILGRRRENISRAIAILLVFALVLFPAAYVATSKSVDGGSIQVWSVRDLSTHCVNGSSGLLVAAALYVSLRSTLFPIPDTEDRSRQASECLYGTKSQVLATHWFSLIPIFQGALSAVLLFAIGFAVRRRLLR